MIGSGPSDDDAVVVSQPSLDPAELAAQVRLAEDARRIVRRASAQRTIAGILESSRSALVDGFRALGMWIQVFDTHDPDSSAGTIHSADGKTIELGAAVHAMALEVAHALWDAQESLVLRAGVPHPLLSPSQNDEISELLDELDVGSILFVPLGVGAECVGNVVLTRERGGAEWSELEADAVLEVGRDLGSAIRNAQAHEREQRLVAELQALDTYKSQLIATVSHELKTPLTSILGHLELLDSESEASRRTLSLAAIERGAHRMSRLVDNLLLLSKVGDPHNPLIASPVDLRSIVEDVVDLSTVESERKHQHITVATDGRPAMAMGDAEELDRVVSNLVSNAVKYTPDGGRIFVGLEHRGSQIGVTCRDEGLGISQHDQELLFTEFFRSTNPVAISEPGTGLGLAIVQRIVQRHGGRIEVDSELGAGSTFRVLLPAA